MCENLVVWNLVIRHLYLYRTSCVDPQVGYSLHFPVAVASSQEFHHRAYAVTMKSVPVVIGFGTITVTQLSVGVWLLVVSVKAGGKV